jgi:hypothetical protein
MKQQSTFFTALLFLLLIPRLTFAAAWTLPADKWELYQNAFYYRTTEFFDSNGNTRPQPRYSKYELNPYGEYGLNEGTTIGGSVALNLVQGTAATDSGNNYGIGDPTLFLRQRLWSDDSTVVSLQPLIKFPSYYTDELLPRSGAMQTDGELRLLGGHSFEWLGNNHFINLEAAYRKRMGDPSDQLRFDATLGLTLNDQWQLLPQLSYINTPSRKAITPFTQSGEDDFDLLKPQLSAVYQLNETVALQAGLFQHIDGNNTGAGCGALFSLWYRP